MTWANYTAIAPACACGNTITKFFKSGKPGKFCATCRNKQAGNLPTVDAHNGCAQCGAESMVSEKTGKKGKYCSTSCKWRAQTLQRTPGSAQRGSYQPLDRSCTCKGCGKQYQNKRGGTTGQGSIYCSRECAFANTHQCERVILAKGGPGPTCAVHFKLCTHCGSAWTARQRNSPVCSDDCRKAVARAKELARNMANCKAKKLRTCKCCSNNFTPAYGDKRSVFCSDICNRRFIQRERGSGSHRRRARSAGVAYEPVNRIKVFDRDGWRCQICGKSTPRARMGGMCTNAPELDHRVPISKGGGHLYANVQCACRQCNGLKGNKSSAGQLPMFDV